MKLNGKLFNILGSGPRWLKENLHGCSFVPQATCKHKQIIELLALSHDCSK